MTADLATDRAAMPTYPSADLGVGLTVLDPDTDLFAFIQREITGPDRSLS
jgi:hypothetical protein